MQTNAHLHINPLQRARGTATVMNQEKKKVREKKKVKGVTTPSHVHPPSLLPKQKNSTTNRQPRPHFLSRLVFRLQGKSNHRMTKTRAMDENLPLRPRRTPVTTHIPDTDIDTDIIMHDNNPPRCVAPPDILLHPLSEEQQDANFNDDASSTSSLSSYASALQDPRSTPTLETPFSTPALEDCYETPPTEDAHGGEASSPMDMVAVDEDSDPIPPKDLFRTVRKLHARNGIVTWLCLPRELRPSCVGTSYNAQAYPIDLGRLLKKAKFSQTKKLRDAQHIAQLVVVKTSEDTSVLRKQGELLEHLHQAPVTATTRFYSQSFIGSYLLRQELTENPRSSWLCLRPQFGRPLNEFGWWRYCENSPVPAWFVWHIFISVLSALEFSHEKGIANNNVSLENIVLNPYPVHGPNSFRDWPDVVLVDFSQATSLNDENARNDFRGLLNVLRHVIDSYTATTQNSAEQKAETDPLAVLSKYSRAVLDADRNEEFKLDVLKLRWQGIATARREEGPETFPEGMMLQAGSQLIDAVGLGQARALVLNRFGSQMENFRALARARPGRGLVVFEKKTEVTAEGKDITRALCTLKFPKKKHLLGDVEQIRTHLNKEAKLVDEEENVDQMDID